ncbi:MAG: hypothetical protein DRP16_04040, partial [Candidatus Aenigmatarchaeota archaeon]
MKQNNSQLKYSLVKAVLLLLAMAGSYLAWAADGDKAIYREATGLEDITTTVTDLSWDTTVTQDSEFSLDGSKISVDLSSGGHYLVLYNVALESSGGTYRSEIQTWLNLSGTNLSYGRASGYIRRSGGTDETWPFGVAVIYASAGADLKVQAQRTDDNSATVRRRANESGLMLIKLPDSWDYARIKETGGGQTFTSSSWTAFSWDTNEELDTDSFSHSGDTANITLKTAGHYLVTVNIHMQTSSTNRTNAEMRLTLDGSEIPGTRTTAYLRGLNSTNDHNVVYAGIIETSSANQVLNVECRREAGATITTIGGNCGITIVKLPDYADYIRLTKTVNQAVDGTDDPITWNSEQEKDTNSFSHSTSTNSERITVQQAGDYLFLSSFYAYSSSSANVRLYPHWQWRKNGSKFSYGSSGKYNRGRNGALSSGNALGIIAHNLSSGDYIDVVNTDESTGTNADCQFQANRVGLQGVNIDSLFDTTPPNNPTACSGWDTSAKANSLTDGVWQNSYNSAYFEWSGASDDKTGVSGYSVYWGTDSNGEPGTTQEQTETFYDAGTVSSEGIYYLRVRTFDNWGNYSEPVTLFTFKYDATAPSNPASASAWQTSLKVNSINDDTWQNSDDTPYFEWSGATDATSGVSGYSVYWGTDPNGEPGTTQEQSSVSYGEVSSAGEGVFYLRLRTFDVAGNYSSAQTVFTFKYDATAPSNPSAPASCWDSSSKTTPISDNTPQNSDDTPYFEWSGATDATSGVSGYSVYWGTDPNGEPGTTQEQSNASYDVTTPTGNATYYLRVRTFDNTGNYSSPLTLFTFIYDNQKPTVTIQVSPNPTGAIAAGNLQFTLTFSESMDTSTSPTVSYDPAGPTGSQSVSTNGSWSTTTYTNDTYTVYNDNAITSSTGDGTATITVSGAKDIAGNTMDADTDDTFTIDTAIHHFKITHDGQGLINVAEDVTITAKTQGGNTVTDYTGTITLSTLGESGEVSWSLKSGSGTFTDGGASSDTATYTFDSADHGEVVVQVTDTAADTLDIEVTDATYNDDDTEGNLVISSYALDHFVITHDNSATAGVAETITITAIDTQGQTKTDYVGTITLDTNGDPDSISWSLQSGRGIFSDGGGGSDTAIYTFNINDNGQASFSFTDTKKETVDIDCYDGSIYDDDTEANMVISPAGLDHFVVSHDGSAVAGVAETVSVAAYDAYDNLKDDYTGQITLDTNGTATTISWSLVSGSGTFTDGGASSDTATYTFDSADNGSATFSITDTTQETIDIDVSGSGKTDDDS